VGIFIYTSKNVFGKKSQYQYLCKVMIYLITYHEGTEGEYMYRCTFSLTLAL